MIQKVAPRNLARAILTLAARSGNKIVQAIHPDRISKDRDHGALPKRTTITVETETLLVVRSERRTSRSSTEADDAPRVPPDEHNPSGNAPNNLETLPACACQVRGAGANEN